MISGTIKASPMKLCTVIVLLDPIQARILPFEGPGGSLRIPLMISGTTEGLPNETLHSNGTT